MPCIAVPTKVNCERGAGNVDEFLVLAASIKTKKGISWHATKKRWRVEKRCGGEKLTAHSIPERATMAAVRDAYRGAEAKLSELEARFSKFSQMDLSIDFN